VSGVTTRLVTAKLRLQVRASVGSGSAGLGVVRSMTDTGWSETGMTYNNRPDIDGATVGTFGPVVQDQWYEIDVTSVVDSNGSYSFGLSSVATDGARFESS
jgi:acid phosphatase type 7